MKKILALTCALVLILSCVPASALVLRKGDKGTAVTKVQTALVNGGWTDLKVDGVYGTTTVEAVSYFQLMNGLVVDGKAGPRTLKKLLGVSTLDNEIDDDGTLRKGSTGTKVRALQTKLKALGYSVKVDGTFGNATYNAVKKFQKINGLVVDGVAGEKTLARLNSSGAVPYTEEKVYSTLKRGMTGTAVKKLQNKLKSLGYYTGSVTGYFNIDTEEAVRLFQLDNNLAVDGKAGQKTLTKLYK